MPSLDIQKAALTLIEAEEAGRAVEPLTSRWPEFTVQEAYAVQDAALELRLARGERVVGVKLGLTSPAKQQRMNVSEPLVAWLTDRMLAEGDAPVPVDGYIHPRVEPEIVFTLAAPLAGPDVTREQAAACVGEVGVGLELIDSRYQDYRFTLPDVVADNASSGRYVLGSATRPLDAAPDLRTVSCRLTLNGAEAARGVGADVLDDPLQALVFAAEVLGRRGLRIEAGWTVLTGGITDAVPVSSGDLVQAEFDGLGPVALRAG
ncbi:fumarylacetoacetate hydrolase family protein [Streptomyces sp. NPDC038707]|uniref:2-keto-4-pentenoate hydratase n=1 Tax=unclassified Streptomyces TaxID=2593676 RepID=UPI0033F496D1